MGMRSRLKRATLSWPTPLSLLDILLSALVWLFSTEHLPECSSPGPGNTFCFLLGRSMYSLFVADETGRLYIQASFHSTSFSTLPFLLFWSNLVFANIFFKVPRKYFLNFDAIIDIIMAHVLHCTAVHWYQCLLRSEELDVCVRSQVRLAFSSVITLQLNSYFWPSIRKAKGFQSLLSSHCNLWKLRKSKQ